MEKYSRFLCLLLFIVFVAHNSYAQVLECDCNAQWSTGTLYQAVSNNGLGQISLTYKTRQCPDGVWEIQIDRIDLAQSGSAFSISEILGEGLFQLIMNNPMGFPPNANNTSNTWIISIPSCWGFEDVDDKIIIPCCDAPDCCCLLEIYVYKGDCGELSFTEVKRTGFSEDCDGKYIDVGEIGQYEEGVDRDCVYVCSDLDLHKFNIINQ